MKGSIQAHVALIAVLMLHSFKKLRYVGLSKIEIEN